MWSEVTSIYKNNTKVGNVKVMLDMVFLSHTTHEHFVLHVFKSRGNNIEANYRLVLQQ